MPVIETGWVSLSYEEAGSGDPPILLIHELGGSSTSFAAMVPLLAAQRRVIAVDLRGAGRSEKPPGRFELTDLADDLAAFATNLGLTRIDVLGSALGSLVAALLALRSPRLVRRLMLCAVAAEITEPAGRYLAERAARVRSVGMRGVADASLANAFPEGFAAARAAYRPIFLANDPAAYAELSLALTRLDLPPPRWGAIAAPTLVATGTQDFIWPPPVGRRVAELIPGAEFVELTDAAHFPHLQAPETLARRALAFLAPDDGGGS